MMFTRRNLKKNIKLVHNVEVNDSVGDGDVVAHIFGFTVYDNLSCQFPEAEHGQLFLPDSRRYSMPDFDFSFWLSTECKRARMASYFTVSKYKAHISFKQFTASYPQLEDNLV